MRRETGIRRKERTFHRWLAVFMVAVLLMSESNLTVLAEEGTPNVEVSEEEAFDEVSMEGAEEDGENAGNMDEDNADKDICVCESRCSEDMVNEECPVCIENYENCGALESEEPKEGDSSIDDEEKKLPEEMELPEETEQLSEAAIAEDVEVVEVSEDEDIITDENTGFQCKIYVDADKVEHVAIIGHKDGVELSGEVVIPSTVECNGNTYNVDWIIREAFKGYNNITSVEISEGITLIGVEAFRGCGLKNVKLPNSLEIMGEKAFIYCSRLEKIKIPNGFTEIPRDAFSSCYNLISIELPSTVTYIGNRSFAYCYNLTTLIIDVPEDKNMIRFPEYVTGTWYSFHSSGYDTVPIIFMSEDGTEKLTGDVLEATRKAYQEANNNQYWWARWDIFPPGEITINVHKDNSDWLGHTREFGLKSVINSNAVLLTDFTKVADGEYKIYDITDAADGASGIDTGETITVSNSGGEATVDYYTVTFYDGDTAYAAETPQKAQTVLKGQVVSEPSEQPSKTGHQFKGWVTDKGGSSSFDFENAVIEGTTGVYADWTADIYNITYHLDGNEASQEDSTYTYGGRTLPKPQHSDYDFDGWYVNVDYSGEKVTSIGSTETGDKVYYGRWVEKPESAYCVDVKVRRDDVEWENHGRTFMLLSASDGSLTANFETVKQGEYFIYDVTGVPSESLTKDGVNTGVRVSVEDKDVEAAVDYYTVTFYDGSTAYEDSTPQAMQTVLGGKKAKEPDAPSKEGYKFRQWVTSNDGSEAFNFNTPIERKSSVYASWISDTAKEYCIAALADEGGSISPGGNVWVQEGGTQTFEITPDDGYRIKAVTVDSMDRTDELTDSASARAIRAQAETSRYYTFVDVREGHIIRATFEKESSSGDSGNTGTGDNNGDNGNTGTGDNGGGSGNVGMGDNGGDSDNAGTGDNTDDSDNAFINISNVENAGGSPVENSNLNTNSGDARVINTSTNNNTSNPSKDAEPKTGDASQVEIYATVAMIAGLTYLLLYFADKEKGMTEEKKQELVASMIGWAKRGRRIRKYVILVPIFILLCYYHSIGKRIEVEWEEEPVWAEL